jgi:3-isopropylmalate dehydrogenase
MGMLPSASLAGIPKGKTLGLYEPIHGSAPDIAGQNTANPIATILSVAMMLRYSFRLEAEADAVENAVLDILEKGYRTCDIMSEDKTEVGTKEMGKLIASNI